MWPIKLLVESVGRVGTLVLLNLCHISLLSPQSPPLRPESAPSPLLSEEPARTSSLLSLWDHGADPGHLGKGTDTKTGGDSLSAKLAG